MPQLYHHLPPLVVETWNRILGAIIYRLFNRKKDHLPPELWRFIGLKLDTAADRIRFRAVCKLWTSLLPSRESRQPPWLMLAAVSEEPPWMLMSEEEQKSEEDDGERPPGPRGFVSLGDEKIYRINLPQLHRPRYLGSAGNWIITINFKKQITILNPFSGDEIPLPAANRFVFSMGHHMGEDDDLLEPIYELDPDLHYLIEQDPNHYRDRIITKIVLSSPPPLSRSGEGGQCVALAIHSSRSMLAFAVPGGAAWTIVEDVSIEDAIYYKQRFYAVNGSLYNTLITLLVCDLGDHLSPPKISFLGNSLSVQYRADKVYLVEWLDQLLVVTRFLDIFLDAPPFYRTNRFQVYKVDFVNNTFSELKSLGDHSLFLGHNTSVSVLTTNYPGEVVKKNCIYFTDDNGGQYASVGVGHGHGHDMGVFNLEDESITPHYKGVSTSFYSPPIWIVPT